MAGSLAAQEHATLIELAEARTDGASGPMILRGSAIAPRGAPEVQSVGQRAQIVGGRRIWFFDPVTLNVRTCSQRKTSTVGVREIRCTAGSAGRYRRGFGRTFSP